jgi:hypothetical protein
VLWIMLPPVALASASSTVHVSIGVSVGSSVKVIVVIDVDVAVVPIAVAPVAAGPGTQRKSGRAPRQPHAGVVPRIGVGIIWIRRGRWPVDNRRIVRGNIDHIGLSGLHDDNLFAAFDAFGLDDLLLTGF